jgi:hypothetical protein
MAPWRRLQTLEMVIDDSWLVDMHHKHEQTAYWTQMEKWWVRRIRLTALNDGWSKWLCHCSVDGLVALRYSLPEDDTNGGIGYNPFLHSPCRTVHLMSRSLTRKELGWSSRQTSLSEVRWCTEAKFRVAWGTWRTLWRKIWRVWVLTVDWPMCFIVIPASLAVWTWSELP